MTATRVRTDQAAGVADDSRRPAPRVEADAAVRVREALAAVVTFAAVSLWFVAPVLNIRFLDRALYWGDVRLNVWALAWNHRVLTGQAWPYFDGNIFHPHPATLAYSEHLFGIALPMLPVHLVGASPALVYNLAWLLSFPLLALGVHLMCRRAGLGWLGSVAAGLLASCSFARIHHTGHLQLLWLFGLPLAIYHLDRWRAQPTLRRLSWWALCVLTTSLASWYLAVLVVLVHLTWWPRCVWPHRRQRAGVQAALAAVGVAIVLSLFAWPYVGGKSSGSVAEMRANAADAQAYLVPAAATSLGQAMKRAGSDLPRWSFGEQTMYVGIVVVVLAGTGAVRLLRAPLARPDLWLQIVGTGVVSLLLSLGPSADGATSPMPFDLLATTSGLNLFRAPARFGLLVSLALACLAGAGLDGRRAGARVLAGGLVALGLFELRPTHYELPPPQPETISPLYTHLATLPPGVAVSLPIARNHPLPWYDADYEWYATQHWLPIVNGYSRFEPPGYADLATRVAGFPGDDALDALCTHAVRYIVVHARRPVADLRAAIAAAGEVGRLRRVARSGEDVLYELSCRG